MFIYFCFDYFHFINKHEAGFKVHHNGFKINLYWKAELMQFIQQIRNNYQI